MSEHKAEKSKKHPQKSNPSIWDRISDLTPGYSKRVALEVIDQLYRENRLEEADYDALYDTLCEIETLRDRDEILEELWTQFGDVPMNPKTECIEAPFLSWGPGTSREEIWHWFDRRHSKGVAYLLYGSTEKANQQNSCIHSKLSYFEVEFSDGNENTAVWMCIRGAEQPTLEEATDFLSRDAAMVGLPLAGNYPIDEQTARSCYDFSYEASWPVFFKGKASA